MASYVFPPSRIENWRPTRDAIHETTRIMGNIKKALMPPQKHWWHASLRTTAVGFTTTPMPAESSTVEIRLDLVQHALELQTSRGDLIRTGLDDRSSAELVRDISQSLDQLGVPIEFDRSDFTENALQYNIPAARSYWHALSQIDILLKQFRSGLRQETSPVQLWPHHFDLAMSWFSGRLVPDSDPADPEYADEQMTFGFSTGNEGISKPYFYITAYPLPDGLTDTPLPDDAYWHTSIFTGAVLPYDTLTTAADPALKLMTFWGEVHQFGMRLMNIR